MTSESSSQQGDAETTETKRARLFVNCVLAAHLIDAPKKLAEVLTQQEIVEILSH